MEVSMTSLSTPLPSPRALSGLVLAAALAASAPLRKADISQPPVAAPLPADRAAARQMIPAEVIRIIDGDTVEMRALIWLDQHVVTRVRLRGIDAPERDPRCPDENRRADAAAAALSALLAQKPLHLTDISRDKYGGRVIARVMAGASGDAGEALLAQGHARPYTGGRRDRRCV
jgi:micrococcal nuclease